MNTPDAQITVTRRSWFQLGSIWLALLIVLGNALDPVGPALEARSGSAFNAFTSDVSLGPARNQEPVKARDAANDRDRHLRLPGGAGLALLQPPVGTTFATLALAPDGAASAELPLQSTPRSHNARAPPRA